jgi:hypothetical protein
MYRPSIPAGLLAVLLVACREAPQSAASGPSRHIYAWAGTGNNTVRGLDMMTVLNADPSSARYGAVLAAITVDSNGRMPHHTEFSMPGTGFLFANDYSGDKSFLFDLSERTSPRLAGRLASVPNGRKLHSFARLTNGHVIATVQFGDSTIAGAPGGLAEFDGDGRLVRVGWSRDSAFPGARIRTYALAVVPGADRIVTTSSPMDEEITANVVQIWRLSDLSLLKTMEVPAVAGDSAHVMPFEVRALPDGSVFMNSYHCGFFHITGLAGTPEIERVMVMSQANPRNFGCSVPVIIGHYMVMPIAYAHRYATIDIADPTHPKELASFPTDTTFFPHWASVDPGSDRIVVTDQGDGQSVVKIMHFDAVTGRLAWDTNFKDSGATSSGVSFRRVSWPNGVIGMAMPHGAVFGP